MNMDGIPVREHGPVTLVAVAQAPDTPAGRIRLAGSGWNAQAEGVTAGLVPGATYRMRAVVYLDDRPAFEGRAVPWRIRVEEWTPAPPSSPLSDALGTASETPAGTLATGTHEDGQDGEPPSAPAGGAPPSSPESGAPAYTSLPHLLALQAASAPAPAPSSWRTSPLLLVAVAGGLLLLLLVVRR